MRREVPIAPFGRGEVLECCFDDAYDRVELYEGH